MMNYFKENKKNILLAATLLVALYLIYIFAKYWSVAVAAFQSGWDNY